MKHLKIEIVKGLNLMEFEVFGIYVNGIFHYSFTKEAEAREHALRIENNFLNPKEPETIYTKEITR